MPHDPNARRQEERQLATTFSHALDHHQQLRVMWLSVIRAMARNSGPIIPVTPADETCLREMEATLPYMGVDRLEVFIQALEQYAPELVQCVLERTQGRSVAGLALYAWLANAAFGCAMGKYANPLKPWGPRGRPRQPKYFRSVEEFREITMNLIRLCHAKGIQPTQPRIAAWLNLRMDAIDANHHNNDEPLAARVLLSSKRVSRANASVVRSIGRYLERLGCTWEQLVALALSPQ
jgi:hypothetical protein